MRFAIRGGGTLTEVSTYRKEQGGHFSRKKLHAAPNQLRNAVHDSNRGGSRRFRELRVKFHVKHSDLALFSDAETAEDLIQHVFRVDATGQPAERVGSNA